MEFTVTASIDDVNTLSQSSRFAAATLRAFGATAQHSVTIADVLDALITSLRGVYSEDECVSVWEEFSSAQLPDVDEGQFDQIIFGGNYGTE